MKTPVACLVLFLDFQVSSTKTSPQDSSVGSLQLCMFFQVLDLLVKPQPGNIITIILFIQYMK